MCALFERLDRGEASILLGAEDVTLLLEVCRLVVAELGPEDLGIVYSMSVEDGRAVEGALRELLRR